MSPGVWQILIVVLLAVLLFGGRGKISGIMGDFAKGIRAFRKGLSEDDDPKAIDRGDDAIDVTPKRETAADENKSA
ncbi:MAG: twin-arginine translocase TatA/TatE family subunit [Pseudomonadota bacterium]